MKEGLSDFGKSCNPSVLQDPFKIDGVIHVNVFSFKSVFGNWVHTGVFKFQKGNTIGEQKFEGDSFDDVVLKMKAFIENEIK